MFCLNSKHFKKLYKVLLNVLEPFSEYDAETETFCIFSK